MPLRNIYALAVTTAGASTSAGVAKGEAKEEESTPSMDEMEIAKVPADLKAKFRSYLDKLKLTVYFKDIEPETAAWQKRLGKAREKFMRKYGPARNPALAEERKNAGNERLKAGDFQGAEALYSEAIALDPENSVLFSNRCAARQHLELHESALADAQEAARLNPNFTKAFMRIGHSLMALGRPQRAADEGFGRALALQPSDGAAREAFEAAQTAVSAAAAPREAPGGGMGGMGGLEGLVNNPAMRAMAEQMQGPGGMAGMMQNPDMMRMAMEAMQDPAMQGMMQSPMFQNLAQQAAGNPDLLRSMMGGGGGGGEATGRQVEEQ